MSDIAIVSAVYGGYDEPKPIVPQSGSDVDWVLVTDDPNLVAPGWRIVYEPRPDEIPVRAAKYPKIFPWNYTDAPASIWVDHSCQVKSSRFAVEAIRYADPMAQFPSASHDCLYDEAMDTKHCVRYWDDNEALNELVVRYIKNGHPAHWGLWSGTVIARKHTDLARKISNDWFTEIVFHHQDQVSEPFVLRNIGYRPTFLPGVTTNNEWLIHGRHAAREADTKNTGSEKYKCQGSRG